MALIKLLACLGFLFAANASNENAVKHYERECSCTPSKLWLDIVLVIDTSKGMSEEGVTQVIADVATVFDGTAVSQGEGHHSRIAVVTYSRNATTRHKMSDFKSNEEFLNKIWEVETGSVESSNLKAALMTTQEVLKESRPGKMRRNVKQAVIIYASDFKEEDENDAKQLADQIRISGTDIIVVGFDQGGKLEALDRMRKIASPGFFFKNTVPNLAGEIQHSLCQINCFCKKQWKQYSNTFEDSMAKYGTCLKIGGIDANWKSARMACKRMGSGKGHLASEFDSSKHNFISLMFKDDHRMEPPYMYHIGLSYDEQKKGYFWEQPNGKKLPLEGAEFRKWNKGFPRENAGKCVVAAQTTSSFDLGWQNVECSGRSIRYMCQMESCDTDNYCANVE